VRIGNPPVARAAKGSSEASTGLVVCRNAKPRPPYGWVAMHQEAFPTDRVSTDPAESLLYAPRLTFGRIGGPAPRNETVPRAACPHSRAPGDVRGSQPTNGLAPQSLTAFADAI
jgi:hypothetical protein